MYKLNITGWVKFVDYDRIGRQTDGKTKNNMHTSHFTFKDMFTRAT